MYFLDLKVFKQSITGKYIAHDPLNAYNNSWDITTNEGRDEGSIQIISLRKHINLHEVLSQLRQNSILSKNLLDDARQSAQHWDSGALKLWSLKLSLRTWSLGQPSSMANQVLVLCCLSCPYVMHCLIFSLIQKHVILFSMASNLKL